MVQMLLFIRFRAQLRRTRPELISSLEKAVAAAVSAAGSTVEFRRRVFSASFDEDRIGFWLDMVIFLEKLHIALGKATPELYGYALVLGRDIPGAEKLCLRLSAGGGQRSTGIWCSREVREELDHYMAFGPPAPAREDRGGSFDPGEYREFREWKPFGGERKEYPSGEKTERMLASGGNVNTVLLGPDPAGKRDLVYRYCSLLPGEFPPLVIRFGAGCNGFVSFADAWTQKVRSVIPGESPGELDRIHALLFMERLREEWSPYMKDLGRRFIRSLLAAYAAAARSKPASGVLVLEEPCLADDDSASAFREAYSSLDDRNAFLVLGMESSPGEGLKSWNGIFPRVLKFDSGSSAGKSAAGRSGSDSKEPFPEIPRDICELSYNMSLLGRYFPANLLPRLFEEQGLNRDLYVRCSGILTALGMAVPEDPRLFQDFISRCAGIPEKRKDRIRSAARERILDWAESGKLHPCFNLLRILPELGERAGDALVLKSLRADVYNGTREGIERALGEGNFASFVGAGNAPVLEYIYKTLSVLVWGTDDKIRLTFEESVPPPELDNERLCYAAFRAQAQTNFAAYHIGVRNSEAASEAARKAMHINRDLHGNQVPAFRFFSLVNLSKQRFDDAQEYISFALEQAERPAQSEELTLTCYYSAVISFLYGNLSRAERFALRTEESALALGQSGWVIRAKFLRGRIRFEIGRYEDALEIFQSLDDSFAQSADAQSADADMTVRAWLLRTKAFLGRPSPRNEPAATSGFDADIFNIEAAYFASDYEKAKTLADEFLLALEKDGDEDFLFTEQPDWRSGFSQCECMLQSRKVLGKRLVWVYRAMAQCALRPSREIRAEILAGMQRFMREELLPDIDPNDVFYFYAWYCMLRDSGAAQVDMNTVVSMANKRLQRRASRIDDRVTKKAFLDLSRWSVTLSIAAREYKLV